MIEFLTNFVSDAGALIVLYAPVILSYASQIITWIISIRKIKALDLHKQIAPVLTELERVKEKLVTVTKDNEELKETNKKLIELIEAQQSEVADKLAKEQELLKQIVQENVDLKGELRRKIYGNDNNKEI